jgi:hypothetical protein
MQPPGIENDCTLNQARFFSHLVEYAQFQESCQCCFPGEDVPTQSEGKVQSKCCPQENHRDRVRVKGTERHCPPFSASGAVPCPMPVPCVWTGLLERIMIRRLRLPDSTRASLVAVCKWLLFAIKGRFAKVGRPADLVGLPLHACSAFMPADDAADLVGPSVAPSCRQIW